MKIKMAQFCSIVKHQGCREYFEAIASLATAQLVTKTTYLSQSKNVKLIP